MGFGIWLSVIFSLITSEAGTTGTMPPNPFDKEVLGFNAAVLGFAMFGGGGLLLALGGEMSKAARRREERRETW